MEEQEKEQIKDSFKNRMEQIRRHITVIDQAIEYITFVISDRGNFYPVKDAVHNVEIINPERADLFIPIIIKYTTNAIAEIKSNKVMVVEKRKTMINVLKDIKEKAIEMQQTLEQGGEVIAPFSKALQCIQNLAPSQTVPMAKELRVVFYEYKKWALITLKNYEGLTL